MQTNNIFTEREKKQKQMLKITLDAIRAGDLQGHANTYPIPSTIFMGGRLFNTKPISSFTDNQKDKKSFVVYNRTSKTFFIMAPNGSLGLPLQATTVLRKVVAYFEDIIAHQWVPGVDLDTIFLRELEDYKSQQELKTTEA